MAAIKKVEIENRTRQILIFQAWRAAAKEGGKPVRDHGADLVVGSSDDTDQRLTELGVKRNPRCPSPVVTVDRDRLDKMDRVSR
ncbi:MAG TPA: hypothetical protein VFW95_00035, partial [Candidatus Limnocylindria bacterium]|nr:hypothetical protein [Candidatus Limnocylindria bacterium]